MSEWNDQAVILRLGQFRESDMWLRLLCRKHGLITVFAFGAARSTRRFCGCLDVFNNLHCHVRSSGQEGFWNLKEAVLLAGPRNLRTNWRSMGIAANCLRFMEALSVSGESSEECFLLLEDLRECLERQFSPSRIFPLFFRLRVAAALGFAPSLECCGNCGKAILDNGFFMSAEGRVFCGQCAGKRVAAANSVNVRVTRGSLELLRDVQRSQPSAWTDKALEAAELAACARLIDAFIQYHLGLAWDNGFFRRI